MNTNSDEKAVDISNQEQVDNAAPVAEQARIARDDAGRTLPGDAANYTAIYLARHGETEWNTKDILQGHLDSALTTRGLEQAREVAEQFKDIEFAQIFSSDVTRAQRTAEMVALERKLHVNTSALLRERNWGRYDGKQAQLFRDECRELIEKYNLLSQEEQWKFKYYEDIESFAEINARFLRFLRETAVAYRGQNILVVSHLDVLGSLLISLDKRPKRINNLAWLKLLSDGTNMILADTHRIEF